MEVDIVARLKAKHTPYTRHFDLKAAITRA